MEPENVLSHNQGNQEIAGARAVHDGRAIADSLIHMTNSFPHRRALHFLKSMRNTLDVEIARRDEIQQGRRKH
jgi:hypothetical protein